jgi:hypoxanthine phosphoribosyltransferase
MNERKVGWDEYYSLIKKLHKNIEAEFMEHDFDQILCLARGGLVIGDALNRLLDLPLSILFTSSYRINKKRHELFIDNQIAKQNNVMGKRILLVDDLVDSGVTLKGVSDLLKNEGIEYVKSAVLWKKESSIISPDFFVELMGEDEWIIQPFEIDVV